MITFLMQIEPKDDDNLELMHLHHDVEQQIEVGFMLAEWKSIFTKSFLNLHLELKSQYRT